MTRVCSYCLRTVFRRLHLTWLLPPGDQLQGLLLLLLLLLLAVGGRGEVLLHLLPTLRRLTWEWLVITTFAHEVIIQVVIQNCNHQ